MIYLQQQQNKHGMLEKKQAAHTQKQKPTVLLPLKSFLLGKSCQFDCEFH